MAQSSTPICRALVRSANALYLVNSDGTPQAHFAPPVSANQQVTLAPSGHVIAYVSNGSDQFNLAYDDGAIYSFPAMNPAPNSTPNTHDVSGLYNRASLMAVSWGYSDVIRLQKHVGKDGDRFEFYRFAGNSGHLIEAAVPSFGISCAASPKGRNVACVHGDDIELDGKVIFSSDSNISGSQVGSYLLGTGDSAAIDAMPGASVQVRSISNGITLRVTLPSGAWQDMRVIAGDNMSATFGDQQLLIRPTVPNPVSGKVTVNVFASAVSSIGLIGAIAWTPDGNSIVSLRRTQNGPELLMIAQGDTLAWKVVAQSSIGRYSDTNVLLFVSPTFIYYQGPSGAGLVPVSSDLSAGVQFGNPVPLPATMALKLDQTVTTLPVLAWSCAQ